MNRKALQNGQAGVSDLRQRFLLEVEDEVRDDANSQPPAPPTKPRGQKRPSRRKASGSAPPVVAHLPHGELADIELRLSAIESLLREIHAKIVLGSMVKEYYTTEEVARTLSKRPYTVREWCRLGRVRGEKAFSGRGVDEEWRISHGELMRIQNEGLLHLERDNRVPLPRRLATRKVAGESA